MHACYDCLIIWCQGGEKPRGNTFGDDSDEESGTYTGQDFSTGINSFNTAYANREMPEFNFDEDEVCDRTSGVSKLFNIFIFETG